MSKKTNARVVGLFVLIGFSVLFGIIGKFVVDSIGAAKENLFVMYFQESVKGLSIGSPVVWEGVEVGKVAQIELVANPNSLEFSIPVYVRFTKLRDVSNNPFSKTIDREQILDELIQKGLRARLATQSYITGQLMIELVMMPNTPVEMKDQGSTKFLEIPTTLSTMGELSKGLRGLPVRDMIDRANKILGTMEMHMPIILPKFEKLLTSMENLTKKLEETVPQGKKTLKKVNTTLNIADETLNNISNASKSLRNLTDYLERHPESLLKGKEN